MYEVHEWAKVRELYREGVPKKAIARRLGMSRNTVARLVAAKRAAALRTEPAGSQLDPFKGAVLEMLSEDASVPATVILERLRPLGYGGGITVLKDRLAQLRPLMGGPQLSAHELSARRDRPARLVAHRL